MIESPLNDAQNPALGISPTNKKERKMDNETLYNITGDACFAVNLGYEYEFGFGGKPCDIKKAIYWYKKAGDPESLKRVKELEAACKNDKK